MMKKYLLFMLLILSGALLWGQETDEPAEDPGDPGIVLPSVVLEIEDISVEKVDAGLPDQGDIPAPERELFIPEDITLDIKEPRFKIGLQDIETDTSGKAAGISGGGGGSPLIAEAMLGAGNADTIVSKISFYKPGDLPRFKFQFNHERIDGYTFHPSGMESFTLHPAGTGFTNREDTLLASVMLQAGKGEFESLITFKDMEQGLQGQGDYFSVVNRFINNKNTLTSPVTNTFTFTGSISDDFTSLILTGANTPTYNISYPPTEMLLYPEIKGSFNFDTVSLGISTLYKYRTVLGGASYDDHKLWVTGDLSIEFPFWLNMTGNVGYFRNNAIPYLVPFEIAFGGSPSNLLAFGLRGGYFIEENNFLDLFEEMKYIDIPSILEDNHGWFGDVDVTLNLADNRFIISAGALMRYNSALYDNGTSPGQTGLLDTVTYSDLISVDLETGLRWNIVEGISLHLKNTTNLVLVASTVTDSRFLLEGQFADKADTFGGKLQAVLETDFSSPLVLPEINISGYYKTTENISLSLELVDLLQPLFSQDRISVSPFITPGIRGIAKIEIHF